MHGLFAIAGVIAVLTIETVDEGVSEREMLGQVRVQSNCVESPVDLAPVRNVQKTPIIQRKLLAADRQRQFFVRYTVRPFQVALVHLQALGVQNRRKIRTILRGKRRVAVVRGSGDDHRFALGEKGESVIGRRFVAERQPEGRSIGGCGKWRPVAFESFEAKPGVKRYFPFLQP